MPGFAEVLYNINEAATVPAGVDDLGVFANLLGKLGRKPHKTTLAGVRLHRDQRRWAGFHQAVKMAHDPFVNQSTNIRDALFDLAFPGAGRFINLVA